MTHEDKIFVSLVFLISSNSIILMVTITLNIKLILRVIREVGKR